MDVLIIYLASIIVGGVIELIRAFCWTAFAYYFGRKLLKILLKGKKR